jgi:hypothetical protein
MAPARGLYCLKMSFIDILHLKSSNAVILRRPKNILSRNTRPFFASESGNDYSANGSLGAICAAL